MVNLCRKCNHGNTSITKFCVRCGCKLDKNNEVKPNGLASNIASDGALGSNQINKNSKNFPISIKHWIAISLILCIFIINFSVSTYHKYAIRGDWLCTRGDGSIAGIFNFGDKGDYLETDSKTSQFFGDYSVNWYTITAKIVGSTTSSIPYNESNPLVIKFDFIEKTKDQLILKAWPNNKPMGVALSCQENYN